MKDLIHKIACSLGQVSWPGTTLLATVLACATPSQVAAQTNVEFTVEEEHVMSDPKGVLAGHSRRSRAVRADGSSVHMAGWIAELAVAQRSIADFLSGRITTVEPISESTMTSWRPRHRTAEGANGRCGTASTVEKLILGYRVVEEGIVDHHAGDITARARRWLAPALDCYPLESHIEYHQAGELRSTKTIQVKRVLNGLPDPALFVIPDGYKERTQKEVVEEIERRKRGAP